MRPPAVAGRFYPDDPDELSRMVEWCFRHPLGPGMPVNQTNVLTVDTYGKSRD